MSDFVAEFIDLYRDGRLAEADARATAELAAKPSDPEVLRLAGTLKMELQQRDAALALLTRAFARNPEPLDVVNNLAHLHLEAWNLSEAERYARIMLAREPGAVGFWVNLGLIAARRGLLDEAAGHYRHALTLAPDNQPALFNLAACLLLQGEYEEGWPLYECRWRNVGFDAEFPPLAPTWRGESLQDKHILIYGEQGRGDTIQFVRYLPLLKARGAKVSFIIMPAFHRLLGTVPGVDHLYGSMDGLPHFDFQCALMSLPLRFSTSVATIPNRVPYVAAEPDRIARWRERIGGGGFKIGIAWQGNPASPMEKGRSFPLHMFAPLAAIPGVRLISLQKDAGEEQIATCGFPVEVLGPGFDADGNAFCDSAAIIAQLDLVVCADSAIAHLTGALGAPGFVVLQNVPDWRWLMEREDCPWYPSLRLFRQRAAGDWDDVFARLTEAVCTLALGPRASSSHTA